MIQSRGDVKKIIEPGRKLPTLVIIEDIDAEGPLVEGFQTI